MRRLVLLAGATSLIGAACGPDPKTGDCTDNLIAGDLVITEVFADSKAPPGGSGTRRGQGVVRGLQRLRSPARARGPDDRPQPRRRHAEVARRRDRHRRAGPVLHDGQLGGRSAARLRRLRLRCRPRRSVQHRRRQARAVVAGRARSTRRPTRPSRKAGRASSPPAQPPRLHPQRRSAELVRGERQRVRHRNFGTPGSENDCTPIVIGQCNDGGTMRDARAARSRRSRDHRGDAEPPRGQRHRGRVVEILAINGFDLNGVGLEPRG